MPLVLHALLGPLAAAAEDPTLQAAAAATTPPPLGDLLLPPARLRGVAALDCPATASRWAATARSLPTTPRPEWQLTLPTRLLTAAETALVYAPPPTPPSLAAALRAAASCADAAPLTLALLTRASHCCDALLLPAVPAAPAAPAAACWVPPPVTDAPPASEGGRAAAGVVAGTAGTSEAPAEAAAEAAMLVLRLFRPQNEAGAAWVAAGVVGEQGVLEAPVVDVWEVHGWRALWVLLLLLAGGGLLEVRHMPPPRHPLPTPTLLRVSAQCRPMTQRMWLRRPRLPSWTCLWRRSHRCGEAWQPPLRLWQSCPTCTKLSCGLQGRQGCGGGWRRLLLLVLRQQRLLLALWQQHRLHPRHLPRRPNHPR